MSILLDTLNITSNNTQTLRDEKPSHILASSTSETGSLELELVNDVSTDSSHTNLIRQPITEALFPNNINFQPLDTKNETTLNQDIANSNRLIRKNIFRQRLFLIFFTSMIFIYFCSYFVLEIITSKQSIYLAKKMTSSTKQHIYTPDIVKTQTDVSNHTDSPVQPIIQPVKSFPIPDTSSTFHKPKKTARIKTSKQQTSIQHKKSVKQTHLLLGDAYRLFFSHEYQASHKLYTDVLSLNPNNRNAILGLAAIGIKQHRYAYSRNKYLHLLKLNPNDSIAIAGLNNIENDKKPYFNSSQLISMLKQSPKSAHLYFSLGTQYSAQKKWGEAQSAYFNAWSNQNMNADYSYNLAISLDHLNKKHQALNFYRLSLKLITQYSGNFSPDDVKLRIIQLEAGTI